MLTHRAPATPPQDPPLRRPGACSIGLLLFLGAAGAGCGPAATGASGTRLPDPKPEAPTVIQGLEAICQGPAQSVASGWSHTCGLCQNGSVACWGTNYLGNLGVPLPTQRAEPGLVPGLTNVTQLVAGAYHTCARLATGTLMCWGANQDGQLGDGTTTTRLSPVAVVGLTDVTQLDVSFGLGHTCARKSDGTAWCWGVNFSKQLADASAENRSTPAQVDGLTDVVQATTGAYHSCALTANGKVSCWGGRYTGPAHPAPSPTPTEVAGLADVTQVESGAEHTCGLLKSGKIMCWGAGAQGQLGDGANQRRNSPVEVMGLADVEAISSSSNHSCAIQKGGRLSCWGANEHGQLGDGTTSPRNIPVGVLGLGDVVAVSTGHRNTCALQRSGGVICWGELDVHAQPDLPKDK